MKDWQAHKESGVSCLQLDEEGLILGGRHQVGSCAENGEIKIWDGLMAKDRLSMFTSRLFYLFYMVKSHIKPKVRIN
jgi:hypothetical protein